MNIILLALLYSLAVAVWNPRKRLSFRPDGTFSLMQVIAELLQYSDD